MNRTEPMTEKRYWQELTLAAARIIDIKCEYRSGVAMGFADSVCKGYLARYGDKLGRVTEDEDVDEFYPNEPDPEPTAVVEEPEPDHEPGGMDDPRPWVCEGEPGDGGLWHYYPKGHREPATCGHPMISGAPYVSETRPRSSVCGGCAAAVEQPERPGLEWTQLSVSAWNTLSAVAPRKFPFRSLWLILRDAEGWFRARLLDAQVDGDICRDGFRDIAEAQAWCKAEEDRLLAEQEAKSDD